jgi:hypothetical protein
MNKQIIFDIYRNSFILHYPNKMSNKEFYKILDQIGGGKKLTIEYNNEKYIFEESPINDNYYVLYSLDKSELECVSIIIDKKYKLAEIHGIGNYSTCLKDTNINIGSLLLKLTLKMLKKYKERFNIKDIVLTDKSLKKCDSVYIKLSIMMILLSGHTWYGKYGFRPYDLKTNKLELDVRLNEKYEKNMEIMNTITISKANILKYILLTNKKSIIKDVERLLEIQPNYLLKDFIKSFIHNYDNTCKYFNIFYEKLFDDIGLYNFYKNTFGLKL